VTHSAGGPFGWLVANERPNLVKCILCVEGGGPVGLRLAYDPPLAEGQQLPTREVPAAEGVPAHRLQTEPARKLKNLQGIPIAYVVAERSGRSALPTVEFLKQAGCDAVALSLKDKGILGNGHFMMFETNRKQVFEAIRGWLESRV
jgi:pimeloyl-ACP methyl ester carboxylesterase